MKFAKRFNPSQSVKKRINNVIWVAADNLLFAILFTKLTITSDDFFRKTLTHMECVNDQRRYR